MNNRLVNRSKDKGALRIFRLWFRAIANMIWNTGRKEWPH